MQIRIDIPDQAIPSFEAYLATQITADLDPVTKKGKITPHFTGILDFFQKQADVAVKYVTENFPQ